MNRLDNDLISRKALLKAMQQVLNKENPSHAHIFSVITNAPTVKQLNELIADNQDLVTANNEKANEIVELQAQINELRGDIDNLVKVKGRYNTEIAMNRLIEALAKTAPQCLQEHDNEVIEKCARVVDELVEFFGCAELPPLHERERDTAKDLASQIRALKEKNHE